MKFDAILYWMVRTASWVFIHLVSRPQVSGQEHMPRTGPLLIVANHLSWYDPLLLGSIFPRRLWFFTKRELFDWPFDGSFGRVTGQIPVCRGEGDRTAMEKALTYLREGKAVVIFPEGTTAQQEQMLTAHTGAAMLALRTGVVVLPVAHTGTRRILRLGSWIPKINVQVGRSFTTEVPKGMARKVSLQVITQEIMEHIAEMLPLEQRGVYRVEIGHPEEMQTSS